MKMINRLENPSSGQVFIDNKPIKNRNVVDLRRSIGYVIQQIGLIPHMTIKENISLVPELLHWEKEEISNRVDELLNMVNLDPKIYKDRYPLELSGGQQQRVGVIRALASNPNIILMDEPFSALDPISREQLQDELKTLQAKINKTIVFVTHDMDEALDIADHIIIMRLGEIEQMATPDELLVQQENDFVKDFIGIKRLQEKQEFSTRKLFELVDFFQAHPDDNVYQVDGDISIQEATEWFMKNPYRQLEIIKDNNILGYAHSIDLLRAAVQRKGEA